MQFNRFIPAYHHHFGRQCRVADYGFSKLIELFEAIPDVLQVNLNSCHCDFNFLSKVYDIEDLVIMITYHNTYR